MFRFPAIRFILIYACWLLCSSPGWCQQEYQGRLRELLQRSSETAHIYDNRGIDLPNIKLAKGFRCKTGLNQHLEIDASILQSGSEVRLICDSNNEVIEIQEVFRWHNIPAQWLSERFDQVQSWFSEDRLFGNKQVLLGLTSVLLASLICGAISSLVLTNRMAFFSDALAHLAFAGVSIGILLHLGGIISNEGNSDTFIILVMIGFGILSGCAIALVREKTGLTNDTVIGVFFASAMGLGAVLLTAVGKAGGRISPEQFLFGDPLASTPSHIVYLILLLICCWLFLRFLYNPLTLSSFNTSLARSRRIPTQLIGLLFVAFLAMVVNICLKVVGALLINALLILPSATAGNVSRNMRQFFWLSILFSLFSGLFGFLLSASWVPVIAGKEYPLASGGVIVLVGTLLFFGSMMIRSFMRKPPPAPACSTCSH